MLHGDLGSIAAPTTGSSTRNHAYSPFGAPVGSGASSSNPYQFIGNQLDASGLYYMNARYYSPVLQQFVSIDPLCVAAGNIDVYNYANNSPTSMIDPVRFACGPIIQINEIDQIIVENSQTNHVNNSQSPGSAPQGSANPGPGGLPIENRVKLTMRLHRGLLSDFLRGRLRYIRVALFQRAELL